MSVNKVILVGRLGKDPEVRYNQSGTAITKFNMATDRKYKKGDELVRETQWHRVVAFGRIGEVCGEFLQKGKQVYVEGRLQTREWEDQDGNRRWTTEVVLENMQMLGSRDDRAGADQGEDPFNKMPGDVPDSDVPF